MKLKMKMKREERRERERGGKKERGRKEKDKRGFCKEGARRRTGEAKKEERGAPMRWLGRVAEMGRRCPGGTKGTREHQYSFSYHKQTKVRCNSLSITLPDGAHSFTC